MKMKQRCAPLNQLDGPVQVEFPYTCPMCKGTKLVMFNVRDSRRRSGVRREFKACPRCS